MEREVVALLSELLGIPSPNPSGDTVAIAGFVGGYMREAGFRVVEYAPPDHPEMRSLVANAGERHPCSSTTLTSIRCLQAHWPSGSLTPTKHL